MYNMGSTMERSHMPMMPQDMAMGQISMTRAEMEARSISAEESKRRLVALVNNFYDGK